MVAIFPIADRVASFSSSFSSPGGLGSQLRAPDLNGHWRISTASSTCQWALPELNLQRHCRTPTARARCQWALQDCFASARSHIELECQLECQECQLEWQIECVIECLIECQNRCQIDYHGGDHLKKSILRSITDCRLQLQIISNYPFNQVRNPKDILQALQHLMVCKHHGFLQTYR